MWPHSRSEMNEYLLLADLRILHRLPPSTIRCPLDDTTRSRRHRDREGRGGSLRQAPSSAPQGLLDLPGTENTHVICKVHQPCTLRGGRVLHPNSPSSDVVLRHARPSRGELGESAGDIVRVQARPFLTLTRKYALNAFCEVRRGAVFPASS